MTHKSANPVFSSFCKGSVLLVSLVLLLVLSMVGLGSLKMSGLELRLSGNFKNQEIAFQLAEATLLQAEASIRTNKLSFSDLYSDVACTGKSCFSWPCNAGLCFHGVFPKASLNVSECENAVGSPWKDLSLWSSINVENIVASAINKHGAFQAKYLIEFRCFSLESSQMVFDEITNKSLWIPRFRASVWIKNKNSGTQVMLQSTYKAYLFAQSGKYMLNNTGVGLGRQSWRQIDTSDM